MRRILVDPRPRVIPVGFGARWDLVHDGQLRPARSGLVLPEAINERPHLIILNTKSIQNSSF